MAHCLPFSALERTLDFYVDPRIFGDGVDGSDGSSVDGSDRISVATDGRDEELPGATGDLGGEDLQHLPAPALRVSTVAEVVASFAHDVLVNAMHHALASPRLATPAVHDVHAGDTGIRILATSGLPVCARCARALESVHLITARIGAQPELLWRGAIAAEFSAVPPHCLASVAMNFMIAAENSIDVLARDAGKLWLDATTTATHLASLPPDATDVCASSAARVAVWETLVVSISLAVPRSCVAEAGDQEPAGAEAGAGGGTGTGASAETEKCEPSGQRGKRGRPGK